MMMAYGFREWPFRTVPSEDAAALWADRRQVKSQLENLVRLLVDRPNTTLHLLWANFGAGKTHTLYRLKYLCETTHSDKLLPIYGVLPREPRNFVDVYRAIALGLPFDHLVRCFEQLRIAGDPRQHPMFRRLPD